MTDDTTIAAGGGAPVTAEPLRAESLDASLTVSDLQRSIAWYRDVFGFTVEREHQRDERLMAVSLRAGSIRILLSQDNGARGADRARGEGFSRRLTTGQDIDAIASGIKARGGTLEMEPTDMLGVRAFRLRDPDGFRFTVSSLPER
jgi:predicted enzyme related to lactoylglutathione lyase